MKVVLFCGGLGMRMRDGVTGAPKPMATVGERPLLWHVMRYYAYFGHTDFVLCLGYGGSAVKDFFLNYDETRSNDFVLEEGARKVTLLKTDISEWKITFVDTGLHSTIGERLRRVRRFVADEPIFLANYADVLTDAPLPDMIERFVASDAVASLLAVPVQSSHHAVDIGDDGLITQVTPMRVDSLFRGVPCGRRPGSSQPSEDCRGSAQSGPIRVARTVRWRPICADDQSVFAHRARGKQRSLDLARTSPGCPLTIR